METYCRFHRADAPYWYGEIPLTGFLAAAAWRLPNGWGLLEFTAPRRRGGKRSSGAGDAWIGQGGGSWCALECKVPPIYITTLSKVIRQTRAALDQAREDLESLDEVYRGQHPVALCYVVPNLLANRSWSTPERIQALFDGLVAEFQGPRAVALYCPPGNTFPTDEGRCWPGVVLVGEAAT